MHRRTDLWVWLALLSSCSRRVSRFPHKEREDSSRCLHGRYRPPAGSVSSAISNLTVRLLNQYTGRGPTKARTYLHDDLVTVVLQDTMTKGEVVLVDAGQQDLVLRTRRTSQDDHGAELTAGIEQILQRRVIAFMSSNHIAPDMAVETFVLVPRGDGQPNGSHAPIVAPGA